MNQNPYETLGVDSTATAAEVKKAYKKLAQRFHPDKTAQRPAEGRERGEQAFKQIEEAYRVLKDPINRAHYDQTGEGNMPKSKDLAVKKVIALFQKHIKAALETEIKVEMTKSALGGTGLTFFNLANEEGKGMSRVLETIRLDLAKELESTDAAIKGLTKGIAKLNKYKRKIRTREGVSNIYRDVIEQQLGATQGALASGGIEKIALETALASLDEYEYVLDDEPELLLEADIA